MFFQLLARITSPGARGYKVGFIPQTNAASMVLAGGIRKGTPAIDAQRTRDRLNLLPTCRGKILGVPPINPRGASPTTRRIKPIYQPVESVREVLVGSELHPSDGNLANPARQWQKQQTVLGFPFTGPTSNEVFLSKKESPREAIRLRQ